MGSLTAELLCRLLKEYSPTFHEERALKALEEFVRSKLDYDEVWRDDAGNLIVKYGRGEPRIALVGHIDTVEGFTPVSCGYALKGRGAVDAKGPLSAAFVGASHARKIVGDRTATVYVIAAVGEEGPSHGAWELVKKGFRFDHVIICEPTNTNGVVIEYRGSALLKIECSSPGAHASTPWLVESACDKLMKIWGETRRAVEEGFFGKTVLALVKMACGESSNVTPRKGEALIAARIPWGESTEKMVSVLGNLLPQGCSMQVLSSIQPVRVSPNKPVVRAVIRAILKQGMKPVLFRKYGTSDMNILYGRVTEDIVAYGPGNSKLAHTDDETITIKELEAGARVYSQAIQEITILTKRL